MNDPFSKSMSKTVKMYEQMTKTIGKYTNDIQSTVNRINNLNLEVEGIDEAILSFKAYGSQGDKSLSEVEDTLTSMGAVFSDTVSHMREIEGLSAAADSISVVSDTLNTAAGAAKAAGTMIDTVTASSSSAAEKISSVADTVNLVSDTIDSVSNSTSAVIETVSTVTGTIGTVKDTISNIKETIGTAANAIGTAGDMISTVTDSSSLADDKMNAVKDSIYAVSQTIEAVSESTKGAIDTISTVTGTIDEIKDTVGGVTDTFKTAKETMGTVKDTVNNMKQAKEKLNLVTKLQATSQKALNLVMNANPMGLIITAMGLLIASGIALYQNWDMVKEKAMLLWNTIMIVWDMIKQYTLEMWGNVKETIAGAIEIAKGILVGFVASILETWEDIKTNTLEAWENIKTTISDVFTNLLEKITGFKNDIIEIWEKIKEFLSNPIEGIVELTKKMTGNDEKETVKKATKNAWGIRRVPRDNYNAILHEGEQVLTKREANQAQSIKPSGNNISININGYNKSTDQIMSELVPRLQIAMANI